jgi:hypothetical protein
MRDPDAGRCTPVSASGADTHHGEIRLNVSTSTQIEIERSSKINHRWMRDIELTVSLDDDSQRIGTVRPFIHSH